MEFDLVHERQRYSQKGAGVARFTYWFIGSPSEEGEPCMAALERFLHAEDVPGGVLVKAALAHAWLETMRPS